MSIPPLTTTTTIRAMRAQRMRAATMLRQDKLPGKLQSLTRIETALAFEYSLRTISLCHAHLPSINKWAIGVCFTN